jgi:hypothetical protein
MDAVRLDEVECRYATRRRDGSLIGFLSNGERDGIAPPSDAARDHLGVDTDVCLVVLGCCTEDAVLTTLPSGSVRRTAGSFDPLVGDWCV